jgi:hypothetical protein
MEPSLSRSIRKSYRPIHGFACSEAVKKSRSGPGGLSENSRGQAKRSPRLEGNERMEPWRGVRKPFMAISSRPCRGWFRWIPRNPRLRFACLGLLSRRRSAAHLSLFHSLSRSRLCSRFVTEERVSREKG